jgi:NAD(P)-dependent dehydrogenase (short-subunit alcohol dehydrogenase family)
MNHLTGKTAFITGGAGGIGLGMARAFLRAGMNIVIADLRKAAVDTAIEALKELDPGEDHLLGLELDVRDRAAFAKAADAAEWTFKSVDVLCSNAGVNFMGPLADATYDDWDYALGTNIGGAVNAVTTFLPRFLAQGGERHIVITSSIHGVFTGPMAGVYATTKYALTGLGESLRFDLADKGVGVSILIPGPIRTEIFQNTLATRPSSLSETGSVPVVPPGVDQKQTPIYRSAMDPDEVGERVLQGIRRNDLYIMTHAEYGPVLEARLEAQLAASSAAGPEDAARAEAFGVAGEVALYSH